jgi:adenosylhomocysteine nucleosidase
VNTVAVLFALEREAAPFRRAACDLKHVSIHVSGVGRSRARATTERLLAVSLPQLVIAAGFCGALVPELRVGDVVTSPHVSLLTSPLAGEVASAASRWGVGHTTPMAAPPPTRRFAATSPAREVNDNHPTKIVTVDHLVSKPLEKQRLHELHQADAVDMESAAVAEVCAAKSVRFLAVRAVSDAVDTALSPELVRLFSGGNVSVRKAVGALLRQPSLLSEFRRLARDTKLAARNLADALVQIIQAEASASSRATPNPAVSGIDRSR